MKSPALVGVLPHEIMQPIPDDMRVAAKAAISLLTSILHKE